MEGNSFEWDDAKATANAQKHGVTFEEARGVFRDTFAIELLDDRQAYGEDRFILIGMTAARVLVVVYTARDDRNSSNSARGVLCASGRRASAASEYVCARREETARRSCRGAEGVHGGRGRAVGAFASSDLTPCTPALYAPAARLVPPPPA